MRLDPFVIRKAVRASGLGQNEVARRINAKKGNVSNVLNKKAVSRPILKAIHDLLVSLPKQ
jgi:transcriptional regulator